MATGRPHKGRGVSSALFLLWSARLPLKVILVPVVFLRRDGRLFTPPVMRVVASVLTSAQCSNIGGGALLDTVLTTRVVDCCNNDVHNILNLLMEDMRCAHGLEYVA